MSIEKVKGLFGVVILMISGVAFGQTQVPNTFQAGQPARAAEVNDNFDALETAIDQNISDIQSIPAGPQGDVGPQGPQGIGIQGDVGPQGPTGPAGPRLALVDSNELEIASIVSNVGIRSGDVATAWFSISGETVPLQVDKNGFRSIVPVRFELVDCGGTAYVEQLEHDIVRAGLLINPTVFVPSPNGLSVLKVDILSPVVVNSLSFQVIGQTPCINDVLNVTMYPYVFLGDLPASTPPYSIKMFIN